MPADSKPSGPPAFGFMVMGSELAGFTIVGLAIDFAAGTMPWVTVGMTLFGFGVVFYHLILMSKAISRKDHPGEKPS